MTWIDFVYPMLALIGLYIIASNNYRFSDVFYGGVVVWGIRIVARKQLKLLRIKQYILSFIGFVLFVITFIKAIIVMIGCIFEDGYLKIIYIIVCIIVFPTLAYFIIAKIEKVNRVKEAKLIISDTNIFALEQFPIIQRVNELIVGTNKFYIEGSDISLYDVHNYCFATERYSDYRLGLLSDKEMKLVAFYFEQKYKDVFTSEPEYEHTHSPGTSATIVQVGGVYKAYQNSNKTTTLKAYKFCRKVPIACSMGQPVNTTRQ